MEKRKGTNPLEDEIMNGSDLGCEDTMFYNKAQATKRAINSLFEALNAPGCLRLWIIKRLFPEIVKVANDFREEVLWK